MAEGKRISALPLASELTGAEQIPFAKTGANGRLTVEKLKEYVTDGLVLGGGEISSGDYTALARQIEANRKHIEENFERIEGNLEAINEAAESRKTHEQEAWSVIVANTAKTKENEDAIATKANASEVYTKSQIDELVERMTNAVATINDTNASDDLRLAALEAFRYSEFITADDLPSMTPYATIEFVQEELTKLVGADSTTIERLEALQQILDTTDDDILAGVSEMLNGYFTKEEVKELFVDKQTHDDDNWAKKEWCSDNFESKTDAALHYQPLGDYAVKGDLETLATKEEIPVLEEYTEAEIRAMFEDEVELINEETE